MSGWRLSVFLTTVLISFALATSALAAPGDLTLASTSDAGIKGNAESALVSVSADGTKVAFISSATNLDPADTDAVRDVYVKDLTTGDLTLASTSDAGVKGNDYSLEPSLSADGTKVAFHSFATNLDPADTDAVPRRLREGPRDRGPHPRLDLRCRGQGERPQLRIRPSRPMGRRSRSTPPPPTWIRPTRMGSSTST